MILSNISAFDPFLFLMLHLKKKKKQKPVSLKLLEFGNTPRLEYASFFYKLMPGFLLSKPQLISAMCYRKWKNVKA